MDRVPVKDGRSCMFRVVRVSGTIRKIEEEAIRRAKALMLAAKDQQAQNQQASFLTLDEPTNQMVLDVDEDSDQSDQSDEDMDDAD